MLRIGICDDMQSARFTLRCALERALEKREQDATFFELSAGERLLMWLQNHAGELDLVFLDMEMGQLDGIATARELRRRDAGLQIVFVTAYADRVFDGYSVGALGYLMKPPEPRQLDDIMTRAAAALGQDAEKTFLCRSGDVTYRIPIRNILYFASNRRQVTCVTGGRSYSFYGKLDQVAQEMGRAFVRIHQRYLVRAGAVGRFSGSEVSIGDTVLPVSRSCQQAAMLALARVSLEDCAMAERIAILGAPALRGSRQLCDNGTANAVLAAKAEEMARLGLKEDFQVSLPEALPIADMDLCALLGNALDNAMEAAVKARDKKISLRCRVSKGMLMLKVTNALAGDERENLATTKADKKHHGFGLAGMREIARRYGGIMETETDGGYFVLLICLPLGGDL